MNKNNETAAERTRQLGLELAERVHHKQLAYGNSGAIAEGLWRARLEQYLDADGFYRLPPALFGHIPRITRLDDRINRIIANPAGDLLGEDPWLDAAGDCLVGAANEAQRRRTHFQFLTRCPEPDCERPPGHAGPHRNVDRGFVADWKVRERDDAAPGRCPAGAILGDRFARCSRLGGHAGPHEWEAGVPYFPAREQPSATPPFPASDPTPHEDAGHEERGL